MRFFLTSAQPDRFIVLLPHATGHDIGECELAANVGFVKVGRRQDPSAAVSRVLPSVSAFVSANVTGSEDYGRPLPTAGAPERRRYAKPVTS
jgi:hypothetical protein